MAAAARELGNPERAFKSIQIAGTNGKGTVACLLAGALKESGGRVGLYTSPHLHRFSERIRIDGKEADEKLLGRHLSRTLRQSDRHPEWALTFFELATLTALSVFRESEVEWAVLEVGLGGRLDATSIALPRLTAIASIGFDHTDLLGETLAEIAVEKAAIARRGVPMITGVLAPLALGAVERVARERGAPLRVLGRDFALDEGLEPAWPGVHQRQNAALAAELFRLADGGAPTGCRELFSRSLASAHWPGRFERIPGQPQFILDCAHNLEATEALIDALHLSSIKPNVLLFGALKGKPALEMLQRLRPLVDRVILVPPPIPRALAPERLAEANDTVETSVERGLEKVLGQAAPTDTVLVTGSLFTVAEVRARLLGEETDPPIGL